MTRAANGYDIHPDLEVLGSHATGCWARCRKCGRWFWLTANNLPFGPVWATASALLEMLRAITPNASDAARSSALDEAAPTGLWAEAARMVRELVSKPAPEFRFAILSDDDGRFLVDASDARIRGRFEAQSAQFSFVRTRGGPYVLEPDSAGTRVRIGALP